MGVIDLGFTESCASTTGRPRRLTSEYFPSKVGGKPAFLALSGLPTGDQLECGRCRRRLRFLLQIYAPLDETDDAFHRSLFVFCCFSNACNEFKAFRSQLSRTNPYYRYEPPDYEREDDHNSDRLAVERFGHNLCAVCGCDASQRCAKCLSVYYCSKEHQIVDWKAGRHRNHCGLKCETSDETLSSHLLPVFPEFEIIIESNSDDDEDSGDHSDHNEEEMRKYDAFLRDNRPEHQTENLDHYAESESEEQKIFEAFKRKTGDEVIRHYTYDTDEESSSEPLWISGRNRPALPIPNCEHCGAERRFEFQVMPQLLAKIVSADDDLDWGTLAVYTCRRSCSMSDDINYKQEFVWKQDLN